MVLMADIEVAPVGVPRYPSRSNEPPAQESPYYRTPAIPMWTSASRRSATAASSWSQISSSASEPPCLFPARTGTSTTDRQTACSGGQASTTKFQSMSSRSPCRTIQFPHPWRVLSHLQKHMGRPHQTSWSPCCCRCIDRLSLLVAVPWSDLPVVHLRTIARSGTDGAQRNPKYCSRATMVGPRLQSGTRYRKPSRRW